jgi:hypothetical protein
MHHGDLLVFNGGKTTHSMVLADADPNFNANGYEWRISILFRWTTDIMRKCGPGKEANQAGQPKQYRADIKKWRAEHPEGISKPQVWCCRAGSKYPPDAVYVGCLTARFKGTIHGNDYEPFKGHRKPIANNEADFRQYAEKKMLDPVFRAQAIKDLRGKHLLCWCYQTGPDRAEFCHARVWLEIVNRPESQENAA